MLKHSQHSQRYWMLGVLLAWLTLVACQPSLQVSAASDHEALPSPGFLVRDPSKPGQRPRYDTVQLLAANGQVLWHLRSEPFGDTNSVGELTYGKSPGGFTTIVAPSPLAPQGHYTLAISGIGYGTFRFRVDSAGRIQKE